VAIFRRRFGPSVLGWVNRAAGAVIVAFGLYLLADLWR